MITFHHIHPTCHPPLQVVGVKWVPASGKPTETRAALSVLADGYYSVLRKVV